MLAELPESCRIEISPGLAGDLLRAAERLPRYENKDFYSVSLQTAILNGIRRECTDGFDWIVSAAGECISRRPYTALIRGIRFDDGNRLFVAINRAFGELVAPPYKAPRAQLIHYVQPSTDLRSPRGGSESERLHTDAADWEIPVELVSMLCTRADPRGGGRTRLLDVDSVRADVECNLGIDAIRLLESEPVPWQLAFYRGGGLTWRPVLTDIGICWRRYTIDQALISGSVRLCDEMIGALDKFEAVIEATDRVYEFLMHEGELLLSDNSRTVHARTPVEAPETSDRLMIRSWIRTC